MRTLPADVALARWDPLRVFEGASRPVIHCTGTFSLLRCAAPTTWCAGVSLDRRTKGTAENRQTRLSSQKADATLTSCGRTLQRSPASKAATKFERVAKQSQAERLSSTNGTVRRNKIQTSISHRILRVRGIPSISGGIYARVGRREGASYRSAVMANHLHN